jgi:putative inorganic carbon (HCO3(-)) transporter
VRAGLDGAASALLLVAVALLPFHLWAPRLVEGILLLAALAAAPVAAREWRCWLRPRPFDGPVLAVLASGLVALVAHPALGESLRQFRLVILEPAVLYLLVTRLRPSGTRVAGAVLLGAVAASLVGFAQLATGVGPIEAEGVDRIRGPYPSPNNLGLLLDRAVPLAVALALAGRGRLVGAAAPLLLLALALSYTVGAWLATGLGLAVVLWLGRRRRLLLGLAALAVAGVLVVLLLRPERVFSPTTSSVRVLLWGSSLQMLAEHPLLGVGLDNFLYLYSPDHAERPYMDPAAWREPNLSHPHNLVLDWWLSLGLPGLAALAYTLVLFARHARPRTPLAVGLVGAFAAALAHGQIDNSYFLPDLAALWWLQLALLADEQSPAS